MGDEDQKGRNNDAYVELRAELEHVLDEYGRATALSDISLDNLGRLNFSLSTLGGLLEAELARRDGTTDMAKL